MSKKKTDKILVLINQLRQEMAELKQSPGIADWSKTMLGEYLTKSAQNNGHFSTRFKSRNTIATYFDYHKTGRHSLEEIEVFVHRLKQMFPQA